MNLMCIFLQASTIGVETVAGAQSQSYFSMIAKGGVIMIPLALLLLLAIYLIADKWYAFYKIGKNDSRAAKRVLKSLSAGEMDKLRKYNPSKELPTSKVIVAGLSEQNQTPLDAEEAMQSQARIQIAHMEKGMNLLGITASIAPMLGFLGTIFGVIRIFYDISLTGVIDIPTVSNGLYEKMICSGTGLLVGIIAYTGHSLLNKKIDKIVLQMDIASNEALRMIRNQ